MVAGERKSSAGGDVDRAGQRPRLRFGRFGGQCAARSTARQHRDGPVASLQPARLRRKRAAARAWEIGNPVTLANAPSAEDGMSWPGICRSRPSLHASRGGRERVPEPLTAAAPARLLQAKSSASGSDPGSTRNPAS